MILASTITLAEGDYGWSGTLELDDPTAFQRVRVGDPLTLELGDESYDMLIDNKTLERNGVGRPQFTLSLISPSARFAAPRATPMDKIWDEPIQAKTAAEEAVGESIQWDLIDWLIPGGRLAVHNATPIEMVKAIAEAAGGVVETLPTGQLRVRHLFPVAVPKWGDILPDHLLTDTTDNLSCRESHRSRRLVNRVVIRGYLPTTGGATGQMAIEVDARPNGLNQGKTTFYAGETVHLLVYADSDINSLELVSSTGKLLPGPIQSVVLTQDVVFDETDTATLDHPADHLDRVTWLGNSLGQITPGPDKKTITAGKSGLAIARIEYTTHARSWALVSPGRLNGLDAFPIEVRVTGTVADPIPDGEVVCQRGAGEYPGEDISDPLLADTLAKLSRGRAVIDAGEPLQEVSLTCLYRPGLQPGQMIEVQDVLMGQTWRGKVTSVTHSAAEPKVITTLEVLRHVPALA